MKQAFSSLLVVLLLAGPGFEARDDFEDGMQALRRKEYSTALSKIESALAADPDNLRYASYYRQAAIQSKQYQRCLNFFEKLAQTNPASSNVALNYGFACVDKIPDAGVFSQVILANRAISLFTKALELQKSWIVYYTRGNSYLYWPKVFNRTRLAVADLEEALNLQKLDRKRSYYVRTYISLGDAYLRMDSVDKAKAVWQEGLASFSGDAQLRQRLSMNLERLKTLIYNTYNPAKRVDTRLDELWMEP
ncbi:MAG TPA: hypothetical protein VGK99_00500 [Acidobacteriota bacterium]|jgi:tetratricopeptide (TPR) repeat protein